LQVIRRLGDLLKTFSRIRWEEVCGKQTAGIAGKDGRGRA